MIIEHFFIFVGLLEELTPHVLVTSFIAYEHVTASHRKAEVGLLFLGLRESGLFGHFLELLEALVVFIVLFLNLVTDKTHILTGPDNREIIRSGGCASKDVGFLNWLGTLNLFLGVVTA